MNTFQRKIIVMLEMGRRLKGILIVTGVTGPGLAGRMDVLVTTDTVLVQSQISCAALMRRKIG